MPEPRLTAEYGAEPPAERAAPISLALLFGALLASPLAWSAQLLINYGLASQTCFANGRLRSHVLVGWEWTNAAIAAINLACFFIAVSAAIASLLLWRRSRGEAPGAHVRALDIGQGRNRFFAIWGVWAGVWFALQIAFATIAIFWAPRCGS